MNKSTALLVLPLLVLSFLASPLLARKWTDASGTFSVDARLVGIEKQHVQLKRKDGTIAKVRIANLSKTDRAFVAAQKAIAKTPPLVRIESALAQRKGGRSAAEGAYQQVSRVLATTGVETAQ